MIDSSNASDAHTSPPVEAYGRRQFLVSSIGVLISSGFLVACGGSSGGSTGANARGRIRVSVSGLDASPSGGNVRISRTDVVGSIPLDRDVPASGRIDVEVAAGTYSVAYTAPVGFTVDGASQKTQTNLRVVEDGLASAGFVVAVAGTFTAPDILDNLSFESGWDGFTDGGTGEPTATRSNAHAASGAFSIQHAWTANAADAGTACFRGLGGGYDDIWTRFYFRLSAGWSITTIHKFCRFRRMSPNTLMGGWFLDDDGGLSWGFDAEANSIGISIISKSQISTDSWHSLECHYRRNGDALPNVAFWFNDAPIIRPDGEDPGWPGSGISWNGGRMYGGPTRGSDASITHVQWLSVLNGGNTGSGTAWIDRVAVSSRGRIGP